MLKHLFSLICGYVKYRGAIFRLQQPVRDQKIEMQVDSFEVEISAVDHLGLARAAASAFGKDLSEDLISASLFLGHLILG